MAKLLRGRRRAVLTLSSIIGLISIAALTAMAAPAGAATQAPATAAHHSLRAPDKLVRNGPDDAQGCSIDTCMYLSTPSNGHVYINAWAYDQSFYGYFVLTGPNGLKKTSPTETWYAGGAHYTWSNIPAVVGQYCVQGKSGSLNEGKPCENIE
jgi:hypothetical protein